MFQKTTSQTLKNIKAQTLVIKKYYGNTPHLAAVILCLKKSKFLLPIFQHSYDSAILA